MSIIAFSFENTSVRTLGTPEAPLFVAIDICKALSHSNPRKAIADLVDPEDIVKAEIDTAGGKQTVNPFSGAAATASAIPQADNPLAASDAARAVAEVQAALLVARMNPRDPVRAMDRILNACTRPTLAESSTYAFSRGGTSVTGPTIRLAEALAQGWGNIQYGLRELSQKNGVSTVAAYAWDVETNTRREIQFPGMKAKLKQTEPEKPAEIPAPEPAAEPVIEDIPDEIAMARSAPADLSASEEPSGE